MPSHTGLHYGLKWAGNKETELLALAAAEKLVVDMSSLALYQPEYDIQYVAEDDATYVILIVQRPDYSTYEFSLDTPAVFYVDTDTVVPVTLATDYEGTVPYGNVRFGFTAAGPGTVTFKVTDDELVEHTFTNSGDYPPEEEGFDLPLLYNETTDWVLSFSEVGEFAITFRCYIVVEDNGSFIEGATIAEGQALVKVEDVPLYGDADRNGVVNLLDLVFVRNRLFCEDIDEGDNRWADINDDNTINLEDLIEVRNNLGAVSE